MYNKRTGKMTTNRLELSQTSLNNFHFTQLVWTLTAVLNAAVISAVKLKCSNIDEFYYPIPGSHCTGFYRCSNNRGQNDAKDCPAGSMFDFYAQQCTRTPGTCYEPICAGRTNGVYQDTTCACRRSFTCHSGHLISVDNCRPGHLHNGQKCINQELVVCDLPHTTAIGYPYSGDERCIGISDGSYGIDDCTKYAICRKEQVADIKKCAQGYRFKNELRKCVPANQVSQSYCHNNFATANDLLCKGKRDGANQDTTASDCSGYVSCRNGKFISRHKCNNQAVFNGYNCVPGPLYTCPSTIWHSENDVCRKRSNGFYINPQQGCTSYVRCVDSRAVEVFECPHGQYFDPDETNCVYHKFDERRKCIPPKRSRDCDNKSQGFYVDADCSKYYHCINGMKTEYKCPVSKIFDGDACVHKGRYTCPLNDQGSCTNKPDGYYRDKEGSCRGYYYCSMGHKISYLCEEGHFFDGGKCARNNHPGRCKSDSVCRGKTDGYHTDVRSNCRNYVYCINGEKVTQLTCRDNRLFNGVKCVDPIEYACPSLYNHHQLNCMPRKCNQICAKDGFFLDIDSGCHSYFFCIGGKRSALSCSAGQLFNGEICVAQDKFACPVFCNNSNQTNDTSCPLSGF